MSVRTDERKEGKLELFIRSRGQAKYTLQITKNKKIFLKDYQEEVTSKINALAIDIHINLWAANNIKVDTPSNYEERRKHQELACVDCNSLLGMIDIAKPLFHLSGKRCKYWTDWVVEVRNKSRAWIKSDAERYKEYR